MPKLGEYLETSLLGKVFETNNCGKCVVVAYNGSRSITVKFHNPEHITKCTLMSLRTGAVRNPLTPNVYGKGYVGVGYYNSRDVRLYHLWKAMLSRCYCTIRHGHRPTYKDVIVCDEWLNFQNFATWCESQEFFNAKDEKGRVYQLDKDTLIRGNKIYSPETCCFVPVQINILLIKGEKVRGDLPIGVRVLGNSFQTRLNKNGKSLCLGTFNTPEEAFEAYKIAKEAYIKEVADKWRGQITDKVYEALINYKVEIDD